MNLKKNDKIILIVGVVILIVAGAGIALYTADDNDDSSLAEDKDYKTFSYSWREQSGEVIIGNNPYASKNDPYEETLKVSANSNTVLTNVNIELEWEDDSSYGFLIERGLDTLDAEISVNGKAPIVKSSMGSGNDSFYFSINNRPIADSVQAHSLEDAMDIIEDEISGQNNADFDVMVTVTPGEKIYHLLHFLRYLRDRGNEFKLTATYTYYTYEFDEITDESNNDSDEDQKETGNDEYGYNIGEFYINLGYGRGMI
jgi:hypothetical protein